MFRGGWGRYFLNPSNSFFQTNGYSQVTDAIVSNDNNMTPVRDSVANPFPGGVVKPVGSTLGDATFLGQSFSFVNRDYKLGRSDQFSAGFQVKLPFESMIDASYVGTRTANVQSSQYIHGANSFTLAQRQTCDWLEGGKTVDCTDTVSNPFRGVAPFRGSSLFTASNINKAALLHQAYPAFGTLTEQGRNDVASWYNSLQITYEARNRRGLNLMVSMVFAKNMIQTGWDDIQRNMRHRELDLNTPPRRDEPGV